MPRKSLGPRVPILVRFEPALLDQIDAWEGGADRGAKIHALLRAGLEASRPIDPPAPPPAPTKAAGSRSGPA